MNAVHGTGGRLLAWGLLLLLFAVLATVLGLPLYERYQLNDAALQDARFETSRFHRVAARSDENEARHTQLVARLNTHPGLLRADTAALAGAALQDRVAASLRSIGGTARSIRIETSERSQSDEQVVRVQVETSLKNDVLRRWLHAVESGEPTLRITQFRIRRTGGRGQSLRESVLGVSATIAALWQPPAGEGN